ncbi:thiamine phosphate synthase [Anditalea andensis]|uniref:Thiamine-phosphate synthase n=1 Tax=Anditalea andensis TaxID=1048983 RepID=A0A074LIB9_9BACT|nr:thiamine phosphate synthase [Anditalea andensis]KEO73522.1 thiamine-phosphate pyrophosphorylase [Anditalea andensis]
MISETFPYKLYLVTDEAACLGRDFFWVVEEAIKGGVDLVQLREKDLSEKEFIYKAHKLQALCQKYGVPLIINDHAAVALAVQAEGLHIGQNDAKMEVVKEMLGQDFPIGLSLEREIELAYPATDLAWYLGVSPLFSTPTKADTYTEWGLEGLEKLRGLTPKPLVAIGNIKISNAHSVMQAGADCLAIVSGICSAPSPGKASEAFKKEIEKV